MENILSGKSPELGFLLGSFDGKKNKREIVGINPEKLNGECILF